MTSQSSLASRSLRRSLDKCVQQKSFLRLAETLRHYRLEFHGSKISSDGGLLLFRELDEVLDLHNSSGGFLRDTRTGHNRLHSLVGLLRQSVFGRLAGYEDVNDADRLALDPVMRQVVGGRAVDGNAASASQMGRFETEVLARTDNRTALANMSGQWIDRVHERKLPKWHCQKDIG